MADNEGRKTRNALIPPKEPDYDSLPEEHRHPAREQFLLERAYHLYVLATGTWNPTHFRTMRKPSSCLKASLVERAGTAWNADIMPLQSFIMQVMEVWDQLRCGPCPVVPAKEKLSHMKQEADEYEEAWTIRNNWVDSIRMMGAE